MQVNRHMAEDSICYPPLALRLSLAGKVLTPPSALALHPADGFRELTTVTRGVNETRAQASLDYSRFATECWSPQGDIAADGDRHVDFSCEFVAITFECVCRHAFRWPHSDHWRRRRQWRAPVS